MKQKNIIFVIVILMISSCAGQKYNRGVSSNLVSYLYPKGQNISHQNDQMPILNVPLRVGIAFIPESKHSYNFTLTEVEKQRLLKIVADKFRADPAVAHIEVIPEIYLKQRQGFITIEQVSKMYNVDIMALVSYDQVEINEKNTGSLAYWTIVGAALIRGESTEFQTFVDTAVFDVSSRKLLFRAPGVHSIARKHSAYAYEKANRKMRMDSFYQASSNMTENLSKELQVFRVNVRKSKDIKINYSNNSSSTSRIGGGGSSSIGGLLTLLLLFRFTRFRK
jgi:rhombotail lipoprotein